MKNLLIALLIFTPIFSFSHEGDEEVEVKNAPRFGGRVSPVEEEGEHGHEESKKEKHKEEEGKHEEGKHEEEGEHHHDEPAYMAELLVSDDNKIRLYIYDHDMKDVSLDDLPQNMIFHSQSKRGNEKKTITLQKSKKYYLGDMPLLKRKPFDLSLEFKVKGKELRVSFTGMD